MPPFQRSIDSRFVGVPPPGALPLLARSARSIGLLALFAVLSIAAACSSEAVFPGLDGDGTPTPTGTPVLPDDLRPGSVRADVGQGTVTVDWELVPGAVGYALYVGSDGALATDAWESATATRIAVQDPPAVLDSTSGPGHFVRVVAVYEDAESFGMGAVEFAPVGVGWDGLVPSTHPSATWTSPGGADQSYGFALAGLGDVNGDSFEDFAVGAPSVNDISKPFVSVFRGSASGPMSTSETRYGPDASSFGAALAGPGRVDVDLLSDLVVGAPTLGTSLTGAVYLYRGNAGTVLETNPAWTDIGPQNNGRFGTSVTAAGDVNGDDRGDLCVGAPNASSPSPNGGLYQCWKTSGATFEGTAMLTGSGSQSNELFGTQVAGVGDLDADGYPEVVATGPGGHYMGGSSAIGVGHLYRGNVIGTLGFAASIPGTGAGTGFGRGLSGAGDVDGDGRADFVIGAPNGGAGNHGTAALYLGRSATPYYELATWTPQVVVTDGNAVFGTSIASGDVNADGFGDVLVGARFHHLGAGSLSLFLGGPGGLQNVPSLHIEGTATVQRLGTAIATADVNGDGSRDVLVSSDDVLSTDPAEVLLYYGAPVRGPAVDAGPSRTANVGVPLDLAGATCTPSGVDARTRCTVDWGDGTTPASIESCKDETLAALAHTYTATGEHVVRVRAESLGYGTSAESMFLVTVED